MSINTDCQHLDVVKGPPPILFGSMSLRRIPLCVVCALRGRCGHKYKTKQSREIPFSFDSLVALVVNYQRWRAVFAVGCQLPVPFFLTVQ